MDRFDGRGWQLLVLLAGSATSPMMAWVNATEDPPSFTYFLIGAFLFALGLGGRWLMVHSGFDPLASTYAVSVFFFAFMNAGLLLDRGVGRLPILLGGTALAVIAYRVAGMTGFRMIVSWGAIVLVSYPAVVFTTQLGPEEVLIEDPEPINARLVTDDRDVVIVLVDGYANSLTLADIYAFDNSSFEDELETLGFDVDSTAVSNYPRTQVSVPSLLQMHYVSGGDHLTEGDLRHLRKTIGGRNILSEWFRRVGYRQVYVESGWYGTQCVSEVDICVGGPWPDEALWDIAFRSLLRDLPSFETGLSFNRGAKTVMTWLDNELEGFLANGEPDLIYVHLLAPHPPLFMDGECQSHPQDGIKGFAIVEPGMTEMEIDNARHWYVSQIQCVNSVMARVAALAEKHDAATIIVGDHGPDTLLQLFTNDVEWNDEQRSERFSAFAAVRLPGCEGGNLGSVVNAGRRLVSCMSSADYPDLDTKTFGVENNQGVVRIIELEAPVFGNEK